MFGSERIEWNTEIFAPRYYPIRLITGDCFWFYNRSESRIGFAGGASGGWRSTGVYIRGGMPDKKVTLPDAVQLTWLSETERKFYQVQIELPRKEILEQFKQETITLEYGEKVKNVQDGINFAFEPGGMVFLRTSGAKIIELGRYQAQEIPMEWWYFAKAEGFDARWITQEQYFDMRFEKLPERIQQQYIDKKIPIGRWTEYSKNEYAWKILLSGLKLDAYFIQYVNAEQCLVDQSNLAEEQGKLKHVPAVLTFYYDINNKRYKHHVYFTNGTWGKAEQPEDDLPIFNAFKNYFGDAKTSAILEFKLINGNFSAFLNNGQKREQLKIYSQSFEIVQENEF
ncbi:MULTISPECIES: DUF2931 family protein [Acinetobacter]|uniref:DUF2931 family protein n=1 Tax=Acinetobacter piscicola TaxID=2006115 RepID=A0A7S7AIC1_9GAMM|nr:MULTISPECIES: DUF2931 family protein [Acinetobacter]QOW47032.1 DUF2931 family protein [Acinetobacter piscicola]